MHEDFCLLQSSTESQKVKSNRQDRWFPHTVEAYWQLTGFRINTVEDRSKSVTYKSHMNLCNLLFIFFLTVHVHFTHI